MLKLAGQRGWCPVSVASSGAAKFKGSLDVHYRESSSSVRKRLQSLVAKTAGFYMTQAMCPRGRGEGLSNRSSAALHVEKEEEEVKRDR